MNLHGTDFHPALGTVKYRITELPPDSDGQVHQTIAVMKRVTAEDAGDPSFRWRAEGVIGKGDQGSKVERAWDHVHRAIQFQRDEATGLRGDGLGIGGVGADEVVETIIRPRDMARYVDEGIAIGDCDDFSMYLAALLTVGGVPCSFCTVAANGAAPDQYTHVYVVAYPNGNRVACDASHGEYCGWEVENRYGKRAEWAVVGPDGLLITRLVTVGAVGAALYYGYRALSKGRN